MLFEGGILASMSITSTSHDKTDEAQERKNGWADIQYKKAVLRWNMA